MFYYCLWLYHHKMDIARDKLKQKNTNRRATEEHKQHKQKNRGTEEQRNRRAGTQTEKQKERRKKEWKKQKT